MLHQCTKYSAIWKDYDSGTFVDSLIVGGLFALAFFHLMRLNHFIPDSLKGGYELMVQKTIDRNLEALRL